MTIRHTGSALLIAALTMVAVATSVRAARADEYPARPIHLIVPFPPGAGSDTVARLVAQAMANSLPQPIVVENKSGAGGVLANRFVATSPPDGYTLLLMTGAYPAQAAMLKQLPFDPLKDVASISTIIEYPFVAIVRADSPIATISDLIAAAKAKPGALNYATTGAGSVHHLATELFNLAAGVSTVPIAYRGGATQVLELLAGRVDFVLETLPSAAAAIKDGRVRALAVTTLQRWPTLPNVPALAETLPGYEVVSFLGIAAPAGTPDTILDMLGSKIRQTLSLPEVRDRMNDLGGQSRPSTPADMQGFVAREIAKWKKVVAARNIELQ
jgi:tripartite-type tricarboxylate transporter receptor subunit TctC